MEEPMLNINVQSGKFSNSRKSESNKSSHKSFYTFGDIHPEMAHT